METHTKCVSSGVRGMTEVLPIGSVVLIRQSDRRVMIIGRDQKDKKTGEVFDYIACYFPEGIQNSTRVLHFNWQDIVLVFSLGFFNEGELRLRQDLARERKKGDEK